MKKLSLILLLGFLVSTVASLSAKDIILYGGMQKIGKIDYSSATAVPSDLLKGDFGSTLGVRFSSSGVLGFEQNISFSPKFAKPGLKAFQMDTNLILQSRAKITPYATAGIGFVKSWGQDLPATLDPAKIAAFAFSFGTNFSINYGGGIKLRKIMGPIGANIDVRGYSLPGVYNGTLNFIQTSAGFMVSW
jgi:hypothetical protein